MSDKAKFEAGTYSADDILDWYDENTNETYINSLKNSDRSVFDEVIDHEDDGVIYEIGTVDGVSVILGEKKKPEIFGQDLDTLKAVGDKSLDTLQATPGFLADMLNPKNIAKGMNQGVVNAFQLVDSLSGGSVTKLDNYFTENFPNTLGKKIEYKQPEGAGAVTGSIIGQYVVPGIGLLKLLRGSVLLSEPLLVGTFSSKDEGNMANLFKDMFPDFTRNNEAANIIINGLIADEDDSEVIGRLKNIAADMPIALAFEGIFKIYKSLFKNEEAIQEIKSAGAAATPKEAPTPVEVVDSSGQAIKQADELVTSEKPFYSNVEKTISNFTFKQQPGNQILATLNNTAGIKQSEIQDLGLDTFLKDKPNVSKEELDDFIANKSLTTRVKDTILEGSQAANNKSDLFIPGDERGMDIPEELLNANSYDDAKLIVKNNKEIYDELDEFYVNDELSEMEMLEDDFIETFLEERYGIYQLTPDKKPTKFGSYVEPGGENYKEMLITVPGTPQVFTKHHFTGEVPSGENLIAHARFNDRTIDNKKILFIEEVQSDLHQAGRKQGYTSVEKKKIQNEINLREKELKEIHGDNYSEEIYYNDRQINMLMQKRDNVFMLPNLVPDAPFKKNWYELTMKRLIKYAVDNGYDGIAFTSGDMQVARYAGMDNAEGLKGFYDNTLTKFTNKFSKKYGASLEDTSLKGEVTNINEVQKGKVYSAGNQSWFITGNDNKGYNLMNSVEGDVSEIADQYDNLIDAKKGLIEEIEGFYQDRKVPLLIFPQNMKNEILTEGLPIAQVEEKENKQQTSAVV
tara:strand:+ start:6343 stop:8736 length:2394 start_codon:yes stop_codon:yes gene_type:complete